MPRRELMEELIHSLPSRRILEVTNFLAVKVGNEYFVLKDRQNQYCSTYVADRINESILLDFKEIRDIDDRYVELLRKDVLIDKRILGRRGLMAIVEYLESEMG